MPDAKVVSLEIRLLEARDIPVIASAFAQLGWHKPATLYQHYLAEQAAGQRTVFVAFWEGAFAGYITINWQSHYAPFHAANIPEIQDFNVLPPFRRRGIGTRLLDLCEQRVAERAAVVGIGVGLYADYGAAQRLYTRRGYVLDGRGVMVRGEPVAPGQQVIVDDDLVLFFTKQLIVGDSA